MATQTTHYHLIKPESADRVAIGNINDNLDTITSATPTTQIKGAIIRWYMKEQKNIINRLT